MTRNLESFKDAVDEWVAREDPDHRLVIAVLSAVLSLDDPYRGMRRERGFPNLWFGAVPGTRHDGQFVVTWSYWIEEARHLLVAEFISTLGEPIHPPS